MVRVLLTPTLPFIVVGPTQHNTATPHDDADMQQHGMGMGQEHGDNSWPLLIDTS